jgi:hypothetical protein
MCVLSAYQSSWLMMAAQIPWIRSVVLVIVVVLIILFVFLLVLAVGGGVGIDVGVCVGPSGQGSFQMPC